MNKLKKAISQFVKENNDVAFLGSFVIFDEKTGDVKDDLLIGYGPKEVLKTMADAHIEELNDEKEDFVNW